MPSNESLVAHVKSLKILESKAESTYTELMAGLEEGELKMRISKIHSDEKTHLELLAEAEEILSEG